MEIVNVTYGKMYSYDHTVLVKNYTQRISIYIYSTYKIKLQEKLDVLPFIMLDMLIMYMLRTDFKFMVDNW